MRYLIGIAIILFATITWANDKEKLTKYNTVISTTAQIIKQQFVSKEIGINVAEHLMHPNFQKKFSAIKTPEKFAKLLSEELRQLAGDNHIGIVYSPEDVKRYRAREKAKLDSSAKKENEKYRAISLHESKLANFGIQQVRVLEGNVGYLEMSYFDGFVDESAPVFESTMNLLASSKAIILDLRRNGGGNSRILPLFLGYFLGPDPVHFGNRIERWNNLSQKLYTMANVKGARHFDKPIYILSSGTTFSLAEHVIYHLKAFNRATVIGERTYGGGKAFDPVVINDDYYLRIPRVLILNAITNNMYEEGKGIEPDIRTTAEKAFYQAYLLALNELSSDEQDEELKNYYKWVKRIVLSRATPRDINFALPPLTKRHTFNEFEFEFEFEIRNKDVWMSFRHLPWVKLVNLGSGYFYDDRSIQRQFIFEQEKGGLNLLVTRLGRKTITIKEQNKAK
jgi:peptidase S41-like protein